MPVGSDGASPAIVCAAKFSPFQETNAGAQLFLSSSPFTHFFLAVPLEICHN
jgi:hypothetical protein